MEITSQIDVLLSRNILNGYLIATGFLFILFFLLLVMINKKRQVSKRKKIIIITTISLFLSIVSIISYVLLEMFYWKE
ncbi:hypothetical protein SAMN04488096_10432 [Mesonia phycicola]|uniref:Uncharacterized protein n=1 Tax=Mesonia phycicola TaxID=579105 RepID=A0A1M6DK82_9FLAO|nr:hypothetical protein SAMN04488096_10432 [Mesonia phycicola]